jgi:hypothetical protein
MLHTSITAVTDATTATLNTNCTNTVTSKYAEIGHRARRARHRLLDFAVWGSGCRRQPHLRLGRYITNEGSTGIISRCIVTGPNEQRNVAW